MKYTKTERRYSFNGTCNHTRSGYQQFHTHHDLTHSSPTDGTNPYIPPQAQSKEASTDKLPTSYIN